MESKPWYRSKSVWFNILSGVGSLVTLGIFPPAVAVYIPAVTAVVNIGLRLVTDRPVTVLPQQ